MKLNKLLSKPAAEDYQQVDTFWLPKEGVESEFDDSNEDDEFLRIGQNVPLDIGQISLNYYCEECEDLRTFTSDKEQELQGIVVSPKMLSVDCVLRCSCDASVFIWFLIEAKSDIRFQSPEVRILHYREKLSEGVKLQSEQYGEFAEWLEKAKRAYRDGLGSGAVIYLRKVFEALTYNVAKADSNIEVTRAGKRRTFYEILKEVDNKYSIIPEYFSANGYQLFRELSNIIHVDGSEEEALEYFGALETLVTSILDNVNKKEELRSAVGKFNWDKK